MNSKEKLDGMLIVIGAMKCGTTSLHNYLKRHPEISMSKVKELNFFSDETKKARGFGWYKKKFDWSRKVHGESSPNYSKCHLFPGIPKQMAACMPDATFVYIVRDPIERIISHYQHSVHHAREKRPIEDALSDLEDNNLVDTSRYFKQLLEFLEFYDRDQILLFTLDELQADPGKVCQTIFKKVDVDPHFYHPGFHRHFHQTSNLYPRTDVAVKLSHYAGSRAIRHALPFMFKKMDRPQINGELRSRLVDVLKPDIDSLRKYWGRDLLHWSV